MPAPMAQFALRLPFLPRKRLLAIDPGGNCVKLLLVEEVLNRPQIIRHELIEIQSAGLLSEEEVFRHAQDVIQDLGQYPIALAIPHYRALSQTMDLPNAEPQEIRRLIEAETVKLSGLGESNIVYDYVALQPYGRHSNPFWVTLCREAEIQSQVQRCGLAGLDLCEVTTTANGLTTSYLALEPDADQVVLVDFGATGTVLVILYRGQAIYASHFALGGDALTDTIVSTQGGSFELAESLKRSEDLEPLAPTSPSAGALTNWHAELTRTLDEWAEEQADLNLNPREFRVVLAGGGSLHTGLIPFLNRLGTLRFEPWPSPGISRWPGPRFAAAYGAALQHLGKSRQPVSLLPAAVRQFWHGHHSLNLVHSIVFFLLSMLAFFLGLGTWHKHELLKSKETLLTQSQAALSKARQTEEFARQLRRDYQHLLPLIEHQRQTLDTLQTLALLQQTRSNQSYWFVLFADAQSYFAARPWGETNPPPPAATPVAAQPVPPGFITELCLPEQGDAMRRTLSQLVSDLKQSHLFQNVDLLAADRRRSLVDPAVLLPEHFALSLELPENRFSTPPSVAEPKAPNHAGPSLRRASTADEPPRDKPGALPNNREP
ncbi:MAG: pilus assembly protein PilM [Verrucomicrobia bacterium]|nr:pilus assembly protein PilM [Verrucomicrobiota bacterium]